VLVSTLSEAVTLQLGVPRLSTVPMATYARFSVFWPSAVDDMVLTLSPQSGQPRLFASCEPTAFPNASTHSWALDTRDGQQLRLNASDAQQKQCPLPGSLYVSVLSEASLASFALTASTDASDSVPQLLPGVQLSGRTQMGVLKYFQLRAAPGEDVTVIVNAQAGMVALFASDSFEGRPQYTPGRGAFNYTLASDSQGTHARLEIRHSRTGGCPGMGGNKCLWVVGVLGRSYAGSDFSIVAKSQDATVTLQDGVAVRDFVGPRQYETFKVKVVDPSADLSVSVTPFRCVAWRGVAARARARARRAPDQVADPCTRLWSR
jgi:hypothetical protein